MYKLYLCMFITKNIVYCNKQITDNYTEASKAMCSEGYEYCWMGCMPAPSCGSGQQLSCFNNHDVECCSTYNDEPCEDMDGIYHYFTYSGLQKKWIFWQFMI